MEISSRTAKKGLGASIGTKEFKDHYLDKQEVLQAFNISSRTLQDWRKLHGVTYIRIGNKTYYLKDSLDRLFTTNMHTVDENVESGEILQQEALSEKNIPIPADIIKSLLDNTQQEKSFARVWDPIPGYLIPIMILLIYFIPYAEEIIKGKSIETWYLLIPFKVGIVACAAYSLLQLGIWISKKISVYRNSR